MIYFYIYKSAGMLKFKSYFKIKSLKWLKYDKILIVSVFVFLRKRKNTQR